MRHLTIAIALLFLVGCDSLSRILPHRNDTQAEMTCGGRQKVVLSLPRSRAIQFSGTSIKPLGSITIPAGEWTLYGQIGWDVIEGNPVTTVLKSYISLTPNPDKEEKHDLAANPNAEGEVMSLAYGESLDDVKADDITDTLISFPTTSRPTTYYFVGNPTLTGNGTIGAYGNLTAVPRGCE